MQLQRGFTLIEMMVTVAIIAILAAIALPSYRNQIMKANRSAAQQFMMDIGNREEQYILDQRSYTATIGSGGLRLTPPAETAGKYTFALALIGNDCTGAALVGPGYVITATATGSQLADGDLCFDKVGNKTPLTKWK